MPCVISPAPATTGPSHRQHLGLGITTGGAIVTGACAASLAYPVATGHVPGALLGLALACATMLTLAAAGLSGVISGRGDHRNMADANLGDHRRTLQAVEALTREVALLRATLADDAGNMQAQAATWRAIAELASSGRLGANGAEVLPFRRGHEGN